MPDELIFSPEEDPTQTTLDPWKVLIVDDEEQIHVITKTVLKDFSFQNRGLSFTSAYTSSQALSILKDDPQYALVLLDVVMETPDAGLLVVKAIREVLHNNTTRIVLRTGAPNHAPERRIIERYEIHDFKDKTELTSTKLYTTVISALRSYRDFKKLQDNELNLEKIIAKKTHDLELLNTELETRVKEQSLHMLQQARYADMGETLAMIAHQWKQPLGAINAIINNMLSKQSLDMLTLDMLPKDLNRIEHILLHLSTTIEAFSDFFKPSKAKQSCNICSIIDKALELISASLDEEHIQIEKQYETCPLFMSFDNELIQVVLNILNNSKDCLLGKNIKDPMIKISVILHEQEIILSFEDNAGGIDENILPYIFDPYTSTKSKNATGLGLYMSHVIIDEHCGGKIEAKNTLEGAVFTIILPLDE